MMKDHGEALALGVEAHRAAREDGFSSSPRDMLALRPGMRNSKKYREQGLWRDETFLDDVRRWRDETPESTAISARSTGFQAGDRGLTYREYAESVERFAAALYELGVGPGQVVAAQLPNWWQVNALTLACLRVGAVFAPMITTVRERELERMLRGLGASVLVTTDQWEGFDHAAAAAAMAPRLPALRHRVVLGSRVRRDEIDFVRYFQDTPWERTHPMALEDARHDPDRVAFAMFTSGTSGAPKAILHSCNTLYASMAPRVAGSRFSGQDQYDAQDAFYTPHALTHVMGLGVGLLGSLMTGGTCVMTDVWDPAGALEWMDRTRTTLLLAAPVFVSQLLAAAAPGASAPSALRIVYCGGAPVPVRLTADVRTVLGVPLRTGWGMTEILSGTTTTPGDSDDWAARSSGRAVPGVEIDLRADGEMHGENPGRLFVRGAGLCLGTLGRDGGEAVLLEERNDGWYDTGDFAIPDGGGGIRLAGRAVDRIGAGFMIPVLDVEDALRGHPAVADVALIGLPDGTPGGELACAVVVATPGTSGPALADLRAWLTEQGMTEWYQPSRVEVVAALPRTYTGKVRKELLKRWLLGEADLTAE
ncbi:AMP-binding protein [Streptomyces sp. NPDC059906]|uniref:AMP-binding protein n=1 Tax=Streptomyces sp. NPDC059906 TaxID=3346997 RepID=UPI0036587E62